MLEDYSVNMKTVEIIEKIIIPQAAKLNIGVEKLANGTTVIDMGVNCSGGWLAGKYFVEIGLGGLGKLDFGKMLLKNYFVPTALVHVSYPAIAEMASHVAYWKIDCNSKNVVISGPVRAIIGSDIFARAIEYRDYKTTKAVALIQTTEIPDEELAQYISESTAIPTKDIYIIVAKTASIVGAIQISARNIEQTLPTLYDRGFDINKIVQASASAPIVSIVDDEITAYGRVNDCLIYGQETNVYVRCSDKEITEILQDIPLSKKKNRHIFGTHFRKLFIECDCDWAKVPRDWDAPAKVNIFNLTTGNTFTTGFINYEVLYRDYLGIEE